MADELPDTPENRLAAAKRYMAAAPILADILTKVGQLYPGVTQDQLARIRSVVRESVIEDAMLKLLVESLTVRELDAMARFYASPEGRSARAKLGRVVTAAGPVIAAEIKRAFEQL
jgi:hypothetical protein